MNYLRVVAMATNQDDTTAATNDRGPTSDATDPGSGDPPVPSRPGGHGDDPIIWLGSYRVQSETKRICTPVAAVILDIVILGMRLGWAIEKPTGYITVSPDPLFLDRTVLPDGRPRFDYEDALKVFPDDRVAGIPGNYVGDQVEEVTPDDLSTDHLDYETRPMRHGQRFSFVTTRSMLEDSGEKAKTMYLLSDEEFREFASADDGDDEDDLPPAVETATAVTA